MWEPPVGFPPTLTPFKAHLSMLDDGGKKARTPTPPQGWGKGFWQDGALSSVGQALFRFQP